MWYHLLVVISILYVSHSSLLLFQALRRFRHPHIVTLYGYHLSPGSSDQYLVYEFTAKGSLNTFYKTEESRSSLSSERQLQIMFDIIRAIHCLHTDTKDNHILFHRDIKSANICLERNYTAKLIDCGLAKFVPVNDSSSISGIPFSVRNTSGSAIFGTPGYICPWYSHGRKTFEASCDVYSFGMVMIELVTGCLQFGRLKDFYERYFLEDSDVTPTQKLNAAIPKLEEDVDLLAEEWEDGILITV